MDRTSPRGQNSRVENGSAATFDPCNHFGAPPLSPLSSPLSQPGIQSPMSSSSTMNSVQNVNVSPVNHNSKERVAPATATMTLPSGKKVRKVKRAEAKKYRVSDSVSVNTGTTMTTADSNYFNFEDDDDESLNERVTETLRRARAVAVGSSTSPMSVSRSNDLSPTGGTQTPSWVASYQISDAAEVNESKKFSVEKNRETSNKLATEEESEDILPSGWNQIKQEAISQNLELREKDVTLNCVSTAVNETDATASKSDVNNHIKVQERVNTKEYFSNSVVTKEVDMKEDVPSRSNMRVSHVLRDREPDLPQGWISTPAEKTETLNNEFLPLEYERSQQQNELQIQDKEQPLQLKFHQQRENEYKAVAQNSEQTPQKTGTALTHYARKDFSMPRVSETNFTKNQTSHKTVMDSPNKVLTTEQIAMHQFDPVSIQPEGATRKKHTDVKTDVDENDVHGSNDSHCQSEPCSFVTKSDAISTRCDDTFSTISNTTGASSVFGAAWKKAASRQVFDHKLFKRHEDYESDDNFTPIPPRSPHLIDVAIQDGNARNLNLLNKKTVHKQSKLSQSLMAKTRSRADVDKVDGVYVAPTPIQYRAAEDKESPKPNANSDVNCDQMRERNDISVTAIVAKKRTKVVQLLIFGLLGVLAGFFGSIYAQMTCDFAIAEISVGENENKFKFHFGMWKYSPIDSVFQNYAYCYKYDGEYESESPTIIRVCTFISLLTGSFSLSVLWTYLILGNTTQTFWLYAVRMLVASGVLQGSSFFFFGGDLCLQNSCSLGPGAVVSLITTAVWFLLGYEMYQNAPAVLMPSETKSEKIDHTDHHLENLELPEITKEMRNLWQVAIGNDVELDEPKPSLSQFTKQRMRNRHAHDSYDEESSYSEESEAYTEESSYVPPRLNSVDNGTMA